jgi:hypothetical protein
MSASSRRRPAFGDVLRRPIPGGLARHYGVYLGRVDGVEVVFHGVVDPDQPRRGVYETLSLAAFRQGQPCEPVEVDKDDPQTIKARVRDLLAARTFRYDVLGGAGGRNCEEVARYVAYGRWESMQAKAERRTHAAQWGMVAGIGIFLVSAIVGLAQYLGQRDRRV